MLEGQVGACLKHENYDEKWQNGIMISLNITELIMVSSQ